MRSKAKEIPHTGHKCAVAGCKEPGDYRAPKSRDHSNEYQYLCLTHIREFNRAWDYFTGWSRDDIEDFMHDAAFGHRPTWKIGSQPLFTSDKLRDSFYRMLGEKAPGSGQPMEPRVSRKEREALAILDLDPGADIGLVKTQYKKLVKKYHPDVNKGNKASEEIFKNITSAYNLLIKLHGPRDEK